MNPDWFYSSEGKSVGPITLDEIKRLVSSGALSHDVLVWTSSMGAWEALSSLDAKRSGRPESDMPNSQAPTYVSLPTSSWVKIIGIPLGLGISQLLIGVAIALIGMMAGADEKAIDGLAKIVGYFTIICCMAWVVNDAKKIGYSKFVKPRTWSYITPLGICCCCMLAFPVYLYQREEILHGLRPRIA